MPKYIIIIILIITSVIYYFFSFGSEESSQTFLTISTFLFAIFTGFFIARQGKRYSIIRELITGFDGEISSLYRHFGHIGQEAQKKAQSIIKKHYQVILEKQAWDYNFVNKSNTLTSLHYLAENSTKNKNLPSLKHLALQRILTSLENLQVARKGMVAIHEERIPKFQWFLIYFLGFVLLLSVSTISSQYYLLGSLLKGSFITSIIFIIFLLHQFDRLKFFENTIGEHSAYDILDIFAGKK